MRRICIVAVLMLTVGIAHASMTTTKNVRAGQPELLTSVIDMAKKPGTVVVFDLDSTLFNPAPRYVAIINEYAAANKLKVKKLDGTKVDSSWFSDDDLKNLGIPADKIADFRKFWKDRFFTGDYALKYDVPLPGAKEYVQKIYDTGAMVIYQSGRNEKMRQGSMDSLKKYGFPTGDRTVMILKDQVDIPDPEFKKQAIQKMKSKGKVVALFDNEPENVNIFAEGMPETLVVFVNSDHSPKPIQPKASLKWIDGWLSN